MFIKKIYMAEQTIKNNLLLFEHDSPEWFLEKSKLQLLGRIIKYIRTDGVARESARSKLSALMQTHFDYGRVGAMFDTSANSIQSSMSYLSKNLENKVGKETIDLLLGGQIQEAVDNFEACSSTYVLNDLIPAEFAQRIPLKLPKYLSMEDCSKELQFLRSINMTVLNQQFSELDLEKLILLRYILASRDDRYKAERLALHSYLVGR